MLTAEVEMTEISLSSLMSVLFYPGRWKQPVPLTVELSTNRGQCWTFPLSLCSIYKLNE